MDGGLEITTTLNRPPEMSKVQLLIGSRRASACFCQDSSSLSGECAFVFARAEEEAFNLLRPQQQGAATQSRIKRKHATWGRAHGRGTQRKCHLPEAADEPSRRRPIQPPGRRPGERPGSRSCWSPCSSPMAGRPCQATSKAAASLVQPWAGFARPRRCRGGTGGASLPRPAAALQEHHSGLVARGLS